MKRVDLNADMGESFGPWAMGNDQALLEIVTSANIACGFHAGDPDVMAATMKSAIDRKVGIGAHPGLPDLQGFGRRSMAIGPKTLGNMIRYQLGAAIAMAESVGGEVTHFKLHGALSHMAVADEDVAKACFGAVQDINPDIVILVLAATPMQEVATRMRCKCAAEIFADRAYLDDGTLMDRRLPGSVIHDPELAAGRICEMVSEGAIITETGKRIKTDIDTICVHGDTPEAIEISRSVRDGLQANGVRVTGLSGPEAGQLVDLP